MKLESDPADKLVRDGEHPGPITELTPIYIDEKFPVGLI